MNEINIIATSLVTEPGLAGVSLGSRFGRMDLSCRLALAAVERLGIDFGALARDRIGICLAATAGSLSTDIEFWNGRDNPGGASPILFAYTLPSAALAEIAIRHQLTGPNRCFIGGQAGVLPEAIDLLDSGEADGCLALALEVITPAAAEIITAPPAARACAAFLRRGGQGRLWPAGFDRDMEWLCNQPR